MGSSITPKLLLYPVLVLATLFIQLAACAPAFAQEQSQSDGILVSRPAFNHEMLEHNQDLRKLDLFLNAVESDVLEPGKLYVGASLTAIADLQISNTDSKFAYLMRHPTANNELGTVVTEAALHSAQVLFAGQVVDWLSIYGEFLYDPQQSFGPGTTTALGRNQIQLRKGYVLVGNPKERPLYLALGKMDTNFGLTGSVNPFTNSTFWHAFGGLGYGVTLGLRSEGFNASLMAVQGGAQFRALHTPVDSTAVPSRLNNFVLDANYSFATGDGDFTVGGSFVRGSAYCQNFPVVHFQACDNPNGAMSAYGQFDYDDKLKVMASYAITRDEWPGTFNPNAPLNTFEASKVSSKSIGLLYRLNHSDKFQYVLSGEFSDFVAGPVGSPWERQNQLVFGFSTVVKGCSRLFVEGFRTSGYAPLNFISGGHIPGVQNVTHSDRDARSHGVVVGGVITL